MDPLIQIENLSLYLNGKTILEDINLVLNKGDFLGLIGPNGGGKTTLIRCLLGFIKFQRGKIFLFGKPLSEFKDWYKIGYVPQRASFYTNAFFPFTVKEFILLPSQWYKKDYSKDHLQKLLELFGVREFLGKKLYQLSFGQLQRAFIVRALLLKPEILILDEPSVGLDFLSQGAFYEMISNFHQKGLTVILVTHETWLLTKRINKVACLNHKLYYHSSHEEFCALDKDLSSSLPFHKIEHLHW